MAPPRERQPSVDDLSVERPPKRVGSSDSFPAFTDDQAEHFLEVMKSMTDKVDTLNGNVMKVIERDVEQERRIAEFQAFKEQVLAEAKKVADQGVDSSKKASTRWGALAGSIGTILGIVAASAASAGLQQCRWVPPGAVQQIQQSTPTPK